MFSIFPVIYIFGCFVSVVSFRFGRFVSTFRLLVHATFYKYRHFTSISILQTSTFYKHQHFTNINILQTSTFYKHQHFTNINITNINISNINIANINIASINIHHFKDQKFVVVEVFQYSLLRALKF
jgi:hypothetical protein